VGARRPTAEPGYNCTAGPGGRAPVQMTGAACQCQLLRLRGWLGLPLARLPSRPKSRLGQPAGLRA
jgi:hypothetical protein